MTIAKQKIFTLHRRAEKVEAVTATKKKRTEEVDTLFFECSMENICLQSEANQLEEEQVAQEEFGRSRLPMLATR